MLESIITKTHRPNLPIDPELLPQRAVRPTGAARPVLDASICWVVAETDTQLAIFA